MQSFSKISSHHIYSILLQKFVHLPKRKKYKLDSYLNLHHGYCHEQPLTLNLFLSKSFLNLQIIGSFMMHNVKKETIAFNEVSCLFIYSFFWHRSDLTSFVLIVFIFFCGSDVIEASLKIGSRWFAQKDLRFGNVFIGEFICWNTVVQCDNGAAMTECKVMLRNFQSFHMIFANSSCIILCHLCLR